MSSSDWDDFEVPKSGAPRQNVDSGASERHSPDTGCTWGQADAGQTSTTDDPEDGSSGSSKFITLYESYLNDKKSLIQQTSNYKTYSKDPQKELREWLENEGHEFEPSVEQIASGQFLCTIDLPVQDQDFTLTSETCTKRKTAIDEVCLDACRLLDECQLLFTSHEFNHENESAKKRRIAEANREDDIVFDRTSESKRLCSDDSSGSSSRVNTYASLMAKWTSLNMNILQSKAKLVKLDLSLTKQQEPFKSTPSGTAGNDLGRDDGNEAEEEDKQEEEEEEDVDPLDEFMSNLNKKTKLSMDDKIEKSRLKTQISNYERQQAEVARLLELAKPSFDSSRLARGPSKQ